MPNFESITRDYLQRLEVLLNSEGYQNESTAELSYRPVLNAYLERLALYFNPEVETIFEPRAQSRAGRPDWRFHNRQHLGIYGYIEAKGLDLRRTIVPEDYQGQVNRYLTLGHKIILTDGLDFTFYSNNFSENLSLINKPIVSAVNMNSINVTLEEKFRSFFAGATFRQCSEAELIEGVAIRCRRLSDGIAELLETPEGAGLNEQENTTISSLHRMYENLQLRHDARLNSKKAFSDFVAQVLGFGLLLAHRILDVTDITPLEVKNNLERFWTDAYFNHFTDELIPFKELSNNLRAELNFLGPVGTWYQDTIFFLSHVRLNNSQVETPNYHILFEKFFTKFDPETRFDFGAFYTPKTLSDYVVEMSEKVALSYFQTSIFEATNKIIDPCCGTGTFLESIVLKNTNEVLPMLIGLEILPGPYALAKYRLNFLGAANQNNYIKIFLTNTLSDVINQNEEEDNNQLDPFVRERNLVRQHSTTPITLVIGNPPSSSRGDDEAGIQTEIVDQLLEDFRPNEDERTARQNIQKQISNPFMKFLRWSFEKTVQSDRGICSLIIPSTFLKNRSYYWARKYLTENCNAIYILDIDRDLRAVESSNLFNVQQGRALLVCIHNSMTGANGIFYKSILDLSVAEKNAYLSQTDLSLEEFQILPNTESMKFTPSTEMNRIYSESVLINLYPDGNADGTSVFLRTCNGLKLSPTTFFIHKKREILTRRILEFKRSSLENISTLLTRWFAGQIKGPRPDKITPEVLTSLPQAENIAPHIYKYSLRPFVETYAFINENVFKVLAQTAGGGARIRPEIMATAEHFGGFKGLSVAPAPAEIGDSLKPFSSFCWGIPDNDLCSRGNSKILSIYFPEYKSRNNWNRTPLLNIAPNFLASLVENYVEFSSDEILEKLLFYLLAVLRSNYYLETFSSSLFGVAGEAIPPIYFPRNANTFNLLVNHGRRIADLEADSGRTNLSLMGELTINKIPFQFTSSKLVLQSNRIDFFESKTLVASLNNVPSNILNYEVAGYNVLETYLKFNRSHYTNVDFDMTAMESVQRLLSGLSEVLNTVDQIDLILESLDEVDLIRFT